jgi:N-acetylated-alpha-linked acidic dipeptidase
VYDAWRITTGTRVDTLEPAMGDPGGGSDFAGFYNHFGIPIAEWGFGGASGIYHSAYDTHAWMERFGDPGFLFHATAGRIGAAMLLRIANADVLPYDYAEFARTMTRYIPAVRTGFAGRQWNASVVSQLEEAIARLESSALAFAGTRDSVLARGPATKATLARTNATLLTVERTFARDSGLRSRPWFRSLIYAADVDNGYATMSFPGVNEAIRYEDEAAAQGEVRDLAERFMQASQALDQARVAIRAGGAPSRR